MFYPEDFKKRVKETYPHWCELHWSLDKGDVTVGDYLDIASVPAISIQQVLSATSLEELQNKALEIQKKVDLYLEWIELYKKG